MSSRICIVEGCGAPFLALGYCNRHYLRVKAHGDPNVCQVVRGDDRQRLLSQIQVGPGGCWEWTGLLNRDGYSKTSVTENGRTRALPAHRLSFMVFVGPIPGGRQLDHLCHGMDTSCAGGRECPHRRCINPEHLEPVTGRENVIRGRTVIAANVAKTHCPKGHPYDEANTRYYKTVRSCRACDRLRLARRRRAA